MVSIGGERGREGRGRIIMRCFGHYEIITEEEGKMGKGGGISRID